MDAISNTLTVQEEFDLHGHEQVIEQGLATFNDVGNALLAIREQRLYRAEYGTFEDYCQTRWAIGRAQAYRLMEASEVMARLSPIGDKVPQNEAQARELANLPPEAQPTAWAVAIETAPEERITASHVAMVADVVNELSGTGEDGSAAIPEHDAIVEEVRRRQTAANAEPPSGYAVVTGTGENGSHAPVSQNVTPGRDERVTLETPAGLVDARTGEVVGSAHVFETSDRDDDDRPANPPQPDRAGDEPPQGAARNELYTPEWLINRARLALGGEIDLDPASCAEANRIVRANRFFDIEADGLSQRWISTAVWMHQPYGSSFVGPWAKKLVTEFTQGGVMKALALLPASLNLDLFNLLADYPRCHLTERPAFWGPVERDDGPRFDAVIYGLGVPLGAFTEAFEEVGAIFIRHRR